MFITIDVIDSPTAEIALDEGYAAAYLKALYALRDGFSLPDDVTVTSVAQNRDLFIVKKPEEDADKDWADVCVVLSQAVERFLSGRTREGANIEADLRAKVDAIRRHVDRIESLSLLDVQSYREKLERRLREMLSDNRLAFDEQRILTECAVFADRVAIDEELVRLRSHFQGFEDILSSSEPVGRRLDFLVQEINRETNTIGSKCQNAEIAKIVVDVKCEIEKIREQIQNVE